MLSWVVLFNRPVALTLGALRERLDALYPGQFLPPRPQGSFVIEGPVIGSQFLIASHAAGAAGIFMLQNIRRPYTAFSTFADHIADPALRTLAVAQRFWLSVDLIKPITTEADARRFIGRTVAALAPADAAVLVDPESLVSRPFNDNVRQVLASGGAVD